MNFKVILLLSVCLIMIPKLIFAHGSGHTEKQLVSPLIEEDASLNDSIYSINGEEDTEFQNLEETPMGSPFSSIYTLGNDDTSLVDGHIKTSEPMKRFKEKTNPPESHDQHKKQHVKEALHEWVSPNAKGYKVAIGIAIISGLAFMGLSFFRIGEGS
jgi:hypothetical protein